MALASYSDLKTSVANWLAKSTDTNLLAILPDLVTLAEQRIFYGSKDPELPSDPIRVRQMETSATPSTAAGTATLALPTGWLAGRRMYITDTPHQRLEYIIPAQFQNLYIATSSGRPSAYTIEGENFVFAPVPDAIYTLAVEYYAKPDTLATTPTNALLSAAPGLYLYATLIEASLWLQDDAGAQRWLRMYMSAANGIQAADQADRHSGAVLVMRVDTGNP
jgi:hypothetical protein